MKILVTGAAGFIGSHLVDALRRDHEVVGVDLADGNLAEPGRAQALIDHHRPQYVAHLAARYGRLLCRDEPHRAVADNAAATTEIAAVCAEHGIPVLYASSSEVYGDHGEATITEASELRQPTTIYGLSKRWGEEALRLYLPDELLCVVRFNMLYGPRQRFGYGCCSLATFIANALAGEPFTVHRGASRSWLYIDDAIEALIALIEGEHHGTFNVANQRERMTMLEVAALVLHATGCDPTLMQLSDPPDGQIRHKNYNANHAEWKLGWKPKVNLAEGVAETVRWHQSR